MALVITLLSLLVNSARYVVITSTATTKSPVNVANMEITEQLPDN